MMKYIIVLVIKLMELIQLRGQVMNYAKLIVSNSKDLKISKFY